MKTLILASLLLVLAAPTSRAAGAGEEWSYERALSSAIDRLQVQVGRLPFELRDHSTWDHAWQIRSPHYRVTTTASWAGGRNLASGLEVMLEHFRSVTQSRYVPEAPLEVYVFPNLGAYNQFGDQNGEHHSSFYGSFYAGQHPARPVATYWVDNPYQVGIWATHSAFHQFAERAWSRPAPTWLSEALASYFALYYWDRAYGVRELARINATGGGWIPLARLASDPIDRWTNAPHTRMVELGMLMAYLLHYREDSRTQVDSEGVVLLAPFSDYLAIVLRGGDPSDHPLHELIGQRYDELERDFRAFEFPQ